MENIIIILLLIVFISTLLCACNYNKISGLVQSHVTPKLFEQDYRKINKPIVNPNHVIADGVYLGPNPDGYKYLGSDPTLQYISPRAHRYDVNEAESDEYWDVFHKREGDYTYGLNPTFSNIEMFPEDKDQYIILT